MYINISRREILFSKTKSHLPQLYRRSMETSHLDPSSAIEGAVPPPPPNPLSRQITIDKDRPDAPSLGKHIQNIVYIDMI